MSDDIDQTLELPSVAPTFAEPEYTTPKQQSSSPRLGSIRLDSISSDAPYGYNRDGSPSKRRGRPPGSSQRNNPKLATVRDAREVEKRLSKLILGVTGVGSAWREHIQATDQEANDIADPLAAYLIRQEEFSSHVKDFLDHYDLAAAGIAFLAYLVRVYKDDVDYRRSQNEGTVVESVSHRAVSRRRNEANDATTGQAEVVNESQAETSGEQSSLDGEYSWFPTPYIARDE